MGVSYPKTSLMLRSPGSSANRKRVPFLTPTLGGTGQANGGCCKVQDSGQGGLCAGSTSSAPCGKAIAPTRMWWLDNPGDSVSGTTLFPNTGSSPAPSSPQRPVQAQLRETGGVGSGRKEGQAAAVQMLINTLFQKGTVVPFEAPPWQEGLALQPSQGGSEQRGLCSKRLLLLVLRGQRANDRTGLSL